jgi:hypothetical protein
MINTDTFISITGSKEYISLIFPIPGYVKTIYLQPTDPGTICKKSFFMINTYPLLVLLKNKFSKIFSYAAYAKFRD